MAQQSASSSSEAEEFAHAFQEADKVTKEVATLMVQTSQTVLRLQRVSVRLRDVGTPEESKLLQEKVAAIVRTFEAIRVDMTSAVARLEGQARVVDLQSLFFRLIAMQGILTRVTQLHREIESTIEGIQERVSAAGFDDIGTSADADEETGGSSSAPAADKKD